MREIQTDRELKSGNKKRQERVILEINVIQRKNERQTKKERT